MTTELVMLAWAIILGLVHAGVNGQVTVAQHGVAYGLSPRDEKRPLTGVGARIVRAFENYMTVFPFFAAAVLIAQAAGRHGWQTVWGAELFVAARVIYVFLYAAGIPGLRTLAFLASIAGIVLVLVGLL